MNIITRTDYLVNASLFDVREGTLTHNISADDVPEDYNPKRHEFYCGHCLEHDHFCRINPVKEETARFIAPKRFIHYDHRLSTHRCDIGARYRSVDQFAYRYNARKISLHQYEFSDRVVKEAVPAIVDGEIKTVDRSSRLAQLAYFLMYDEGLRKDQQFSIQGLTRPFEEAVFDSSKEDKIRIFKEAVDHASREEKLAGSVIFQPNGFRQIWKDYAQARCIPGTIGSVIPEKEGGGIRPITLLWCATSDIYQHVRKLADRDGTRASAPLLAMGEISISMAKLAETRGKASRYNRVDPVYTVVKIKDKNQVVSWDFDKSFEDAAANQAKFQQETRRKIIEPRQGVLAL